MKKIYRGFSIERGRVGDYYGARLTGQGAHTTSLFDTEAELREEIDKYWAWMAVRESEGERDVPV